VNEEALANLGALEPNERRKKEVVCVLQEADNASTPHGQSPTEKGTPVSPRI